MAFIQPCFIRKNTAELRRKLESLGYRKGGYPLPVGREDVYDRDIHLYENSYHFRDSTLYGILLDWYKDTDLCNDILRDIVYSKGEFKDGYTCEQCGDFVETYTLEI